MLYVCCAVLCCAVSHQQGGSITPEAAAVLGELQRSSVLEVVQQAGVLDATWDWQQQHWNLWLEVSTEWLPHQCAFNA